jgi:Family of unknown function (DUF6286)
MTRLPRRTLPALLTGLVLLGLSALVVVSCVQVVAGDTPLLPFDALHRAAAAVTLSDAPVLGASALLAVLGVVLLGSAVLPGTPDVLPLASHVGGAAAGVARRDLARDLARHAGRSDGITAARASITARTVRVTARTPLRDRTGLADRVRTAVDERMAEIDPARSPRVRVRVVTDRRTP